MTTVRRAVLTLPAAPLGPDNPLPALRAPGPAHALGPEELAALPREMARGIGRAPLRSLLPAPVRDGYGRERPETALDALVLENDRLRVTVLPGLGGRIHSLRHKPTGRELVYRNPVFQPAAFALNGAWFSGGIEWNTGATGHTTLSCAPLHAATVPAPDGTPMIRLWEWERLRDLPFQVDLWLPEDSDFLLVGVRIRNPHERPAPVYWWSNTAVPERRRVLAPADTAWHHGYERGLRKVPVPAGEDGADRSRPGRSTHAADWFYDVPDGRRRWIAALDEDGTGLVQTSTDALRGRKLFVWGTGPGGRRWQEWLTAPGTDGYAEIQAGLARTQLEHLELAPESELSWLEAYGPLAADPGAALGADWAAARAEAERSLDLALPRTAVDAAHTAWRERAADTDPEPDAVLAAGSGWGALEVLRAGLALPGTPFPEATLGADQRPWRDLLRTGVLPPPAKGDVPFAPQTAPAWRDMLETAPADPATEYHLGLAQWHAGDRAQAVRSWERGLAGAAVRWPLLYCLAVADREDGHPERAAHRFAEACAELDGAVDGPAAVTTAAALTREAVEAQLAAGRTDRARALWRALPEEVRAGGAFRLLDARILLAEGRPAEARAVFDAGFEVPDLREGAEVLGELWARLTDEPLPAAYEFRMRP
ncbi:DUF5107 domain-containing protein [Streptomyces hydrogenans]|uniref:DUF5107 domain-containing protein n=1 Tax=Streptomyces hydrogenans TaxID=1873719 RepID=UPI0035E07153